MTYEKISKAFTTEEVDALTGAVTALGVLITAFAVNLTLKERRSLTMIGPRNFTFVEQAYKYGVDHPHLVPPYIDMQEFKNDWELFNIVKGLVKLLEPMIEKLTDSYKAAGSEAFSTARSFYKAIKVAADANTPGTNIMALRLKELYRKSGSSSKTTTPTPETVPAGVTGAKDETAAVTL